VNRRGGGGGGKKESRNGEIEYREVDREDGGRRETAKGMKEEAGMKK
jgi:hypothetical protein